MTKEDLTSKGASWKLRSLNIHNLHSCIHLDQIALKGLWSKQQWEKELSDSKRLCIGGFKSSNLIAFACSWIVIDELHLTAIAVHPFYRRVGLGKIVLLNLFQKASTQGCKRATLEVETSNKAALALYKSCGFKTTGCRHNYYKNGSDALIQWRPLSF